MGWERPGRDRATGGRASPIYIPAEKVVLHQHVLDTLLQGLLLLLHRDSPHFTGCAQRGSPRRQGPCLSQHTHRTFRRKAGCWAKDQPPPPTSLFIGSSQSWERLKAKQQRTLEGRKGKLSVTLRVSSFCPPTRGPPEQDPHRSSHLIWTQPGLRRKDQGWYHFSTVGRLEQSTSNHRCRTCSLGTDGGVGHPQNLLRTVSGVLSWCWAIPTPGFL